MSHAKIEIYIMINKKIKNEDINCLYLQSIHVEKTLPKLIKRLSNKKVAIYGAGSFFQCIKKYYDISGLNIVGIADRKTFVHGSDNIQLLLNTYYDYANIEIAGITDQVNKSIENAEYDKIQISKLEEIKNTKIDYIIVSLKNYAEVIEVLYEEFKNTKIKIRPLAPKPLWLLYKDL